jgi:hypothetical protein
MLIVVYAECCKQALYAERHMLNVFMLNVVVPSVVAPTNVSDEVKRRMTLTTGRLRQHQRQRSRRRRLPLQHHRKPTEASAPEQRRTSDDVAAAPNPEAESDEEV